MDAFLDGLIKSDYMNGLAQFSAVYSGMFRTRPRSPASFISGRGS